MITQTLTEVAFRLAANRAHGAATELDLSALHTRAEAAEVQEEALEAFDSEFRGYTLIGTGSATRAPLGLVAPVHGVIAAGNFLRDGAEVQLPSGTIGAQCEIAFRLGRAYPEAGETIERHGAAEAIVTCHAAIGLIGRRTVGAPRNELTAMADFALHVATIVGAPVRIDEAAIDGASATARIDGEVVARGRGEALMDGHPLDTVTWLAAQLAMEERQLLAGEYVTSGSIAPVLQVLPGQTLELAIEGIGSVGCRFS